MHQLHYTNTCGTTELRLNINSATPVEYNTLSSATLIPITIDSVWRITVSRSTADRYPSKSMSLWRHGAIFEVEYSTIVCYASSPLTKIRSDCFSFSRTGKQRISSEWRRFCCTYFAFLTSNDTKRRHQGIEEKIEELFFERKPS